MSAPHDPDVPAGLCFGEPLSSEWSSPVASRADRPRYGQSADRGASGAKSGVLRRFPMDDRPRAGRSGSVRYWSRAASARRRDPLDVESFCQNLGELAALLLLPATQGSVEFTTVGVVEAHRLAFELVGEDRRRSCSQPRWKKRDGPPDLDRAQRPQRDGTSDPERRGRARAGRRTDEDVSRGDSGRLRTPGAESGRPVQRRPVRQPLASGRHSALDASERKGQRRRRRPAGGGIRLTDAPFVGAGGETAEYDVWSPGRASGRAAEGAP